MENNEYSKRIRAICFVSVLILSVVLDMHHSSWALGSLIGFSAGITYWCLIPGYEEELTLIKSILTMAIALTGLPWTPAILAMTAFDLLRRKIAHREA